MVIKGLKEGVKRVDLSSAIKVDLFEEFLANAMGGQRGLEVNGRSFAVVIGKILIEAKSGFGALKDKNAAKTLIRIENQLASNKAFADGLKMDYVFISAVSISTEVMIIIKNLASIY